MGLEEKGRNCPNFVFWSYRRFRLEKKNEIDMMMGKVIDQM